MFCPKCGAENPETNQFCRACRENLQVISQAMKSHLPLVIASKVDQILDSRSERFRRDSFLRLLMSLTVLTGCLISWKNGYDEHHMETWLYLVAAISFANQALFEYRAYKRSLSPDFDWTAGDQDQVDSLAYRLGRLVGRASRLLRKGLTNVRVISLGPSRSATNPEGLNEASMAERFEGVSVPSVTESTTRELDPSIARSSHQSEVIYCPRCGRAVDLGSRRCDACDVSLDLIARALQPPKQDRRTAKLDRFIRKKTNGLAAASQSFSPFSSFLWLAVCVFAVAMTSSTPVWWYNLGLAVFFLVSGAWDRIAYRRNPSEQVPTAQIADATPPKIDTDWEVFSQDGRVLRIFDATPPTIDTVESKPIREWQRLYPHLWMLIEVTREDDCGVSEGKLITVAEDTDEFRDVVLSDRDRYLIAIHGKL
jgi:hypothetical protein